MGNSRLIFDGEINISFGESDMWKVGYYGLLQMILKEVYHLSRNVISFVIIRRDVVSLHARTDTS